MRTGPERTKSGSAGQEHSSVRITSSVVVDTVYAYDFARGPEAPGTGHDDRCKLLQAHHVGLLDGSYDDKNKL